MQNTTQLLATHYTRLFAREKNDSPNWSRISMVNKLLRIILWENRELKLLDVWSWPHSVERELKPRLRNKWLNFTPPSIYSLDLANINPSKLLVWKVKSQVFHQPPSLSELLSPPST